MAAIGEAFADRLLERQRRARQRLERDVAHQGVRS
jgi:hypothetical protein